MRRILFSSCFLLLAALLFGAASRVEPGVNSWKKVSYDAFDYYHCHFDTLFDAPQDIHYIHLKASQVHRLDVVYDTQLTTTSRQAQRYYALAAVNGSFFDMKYGNPVCYLRIDGRQCGENVPATDTSVNRKYYQYAALTLTGGRPKLIVPDSNRLFEQSLPDSTIMTAGPMLLWHGKFVPQREDLTFVSHRHNRTALGIKADGSVILLVADGRNKDFAAGLSIHELSVMMKRLGCVNAINFDGGGSSTMYIDPGLSIDWLPPSGVVNTPSDYGGERPVSSCVIIRR